MLTNKIKIEKLTKQRVRSYLRIVKSAEWHIIIQKKWSFINMKLHLT
jgi:hypothetical protein